MIDWESYGGNSPAGVGVKGDRAGRWFKLTYSEVIAVIWTRLFCCVKFVCLLVFKEGRTRVHAKHPLAFFNLEKLILFCPR